MRRYDYHRPATLAEALRLERSLPDSRFIAGGTDLIVHIKNRAEQPAALVSLRALPELRQVVVDGPARIGAGVVLSDLIAHPGLRERYPVLIQAMRTMGSVQIRNSATLGGNLCNASPAADGAVPLLVLDARARLIGDGGPRDLAIEDFFAGPGETRMQPHEILTEILLEPPSPDARAIFLRKDRVKVDLALASVAVLLETEADGEICRRARVAAGAVAPTPLRLRAVESVLEGQRITPEVLAHAQEAARATISPISDVRSSADYRRHITGVYVKRAVEILLGWRAA